MKIAFITACLEPGCDGVGDYTRKLADECTLAGHQCALISLADNPLEKPGDRNRSSDSSRLRLSTVLPWETRIERVKRFIDRFDPDWISLQFVSYGYHSNGIVSGLDTCLSELIGDRALHVMFHELWIGHHRNASMKEKFLGTLQKFYILKMLRRLNPALITTSIPLYATLLRQAGYHSEVLPLFGNISIAPEAERDWLLLELRRAGIDIHTSNRQDFWLFGFFGSLHPTWPPEPLLTTLRTAAARNNRKAALVSIGRMGVGRRVWKQLTDSHREHFAFVDLGERDPEQISGFLQEIDYGIAASPRTVIGKSGTAAAMAEHGVPVIVNWDDDDTAHDQSAWHCLTPDLDLSRLVRTPPVQRLPQIAEQFLTMLQANSLTATCLT
jgi:hypothetical protein